MEDTLSPDHNNNIELGEYQQREPIKKILPTKSKIIKILPFADNYHFYHI